ncbi:ferredoxin [Microbacterium sp. NPDC077663]|uniref:ferredoxin n=1 Tax=Microbacterium sp. NPDC077663 TaxID=3364189 RepID=UPI0037C598E1
MTKLHIDWTACRGRGACIELLTGVVASDEWGYPLSPDGTDVTIPLDRERDARDAVAMCPRLALSFVERR